MAMWLPCGRFAAKTSFTGWRRYAEDSAKDKEPPVHASPRRTIMLVVTALAFGIGIMASDRIPVAALVALTVVFLLCLSPRSGVTVAASLDVKYIADKPTRPRTKKRRRAEPTTKSATATGPTLATHPSPDDLAAAGEQVLAEIHRIEREPLRGNTGD